MRLPDLPPVWIDCGLDPAWEVRAVWPGGEARSEVRRDGSARLCLPRDRTVSILVWPVLFSRKLRPAGAVYPRDGDENLALTWIGGYKAEAVRILVVAGMEPACFDLERFAGEALDRMKDPWMRPPETFAVDFTEKEFRVNLLDPPVLFPATLEGLPGPAVSESPFGAALVPDAFGRAEAALPVGVHRWFAPWGRVSVEVQEDGSATWAIIR